MATVDRDLILEALDNAGSDAADLRASYSGQGMMGSECFGIVGDLSQFVNFMVELATIDQDIASNLADRVQSDTMGYQSIYYFPGYTLGDEED